MTTTTVTVPAPGAWLNANRRLHWAENARIVAEWRQAAHWWAKKARLPTGLDHVRIDAVLHFTDNRKRDAANYHPTLKPIVDGLVDYGLIADDDDTHLAGPFITTGGAQPGGLGWVVLTLTYGEAP